MTVWQRLLITLILMVFTSFIAGHAWRGLLGGQIPSYFSGLVGGIAALAIWELLRGGRKR